MVDLLALIKGRRARPDPAAIGPRQRQLLQCLLENKEGATAEDLAKAVGVTRSAVHQHLSGLLRDGYVERVDLKKTGGRPGHAFALTADGVHLFPKQYDWFSGLLMGVLARHVTNDQLKDELRAIGRDLAAPLRAGLACETRPQQIAAAARIMSELGYVARPAAGAEIEAFNCIYHHLAAERPEVCELDLAFLEALVGERPEHAECMVRGGKACRFRFGASPQAQS